MQLQQVLIVLLDISGYTRFITSHKTSLLHAEAIISELMETVVGSSEYPLQLNKLEGDAALLYAQSDGTQAAARDVLSQVRRAFDAFYAKEAHLIENNMCGCDGCMQMRQLDLKAILHHGEAAIKKFRQFEELAGEDVILAHRLLKNSVGKKEYILISEAFHGLLGGLPGESLERRTEHCEGIGAVPVYVQYPVHELGFEPVPAEQLRFEWAKLPQLLRLQAHAALRILGLRKPVFRNVPV